jgi:methionine-rich copper-binding protein CopC
LKLVVASFVASILAVPATAHPILTFDHAIPAVGSTIDTAYEIAIYFTVNYDSDDIAIELHGQSGNRIPIQKIQTKDRPMVAATIDTPLKSGTYAVLWKATGDEDEVWHTYHFQVR